MKNMYYYKTLNLKDISKYISPGSVLFWDTESCFIHKQENTPLYIDGELNPEYDLSVHVYAWAISNNNNDVVIYGKNLTEFMEFLYQLPFNWVDTDKIYTKEEIENINSKIGNINIWVHNLQWDIEFLKYELEKQKYVYENSQITIAKQKSRKRIGRGHYHIIENNNSVYASTITHKKAIKLKVKKDNALGSVNIPIEININDSLKVTNAKLEEIATKMLTLPPERLKIEGYNYSKHRPIGHDLDNEEQEYLYNDVYILKEWYNQYYLSLNTSKKTASSIAFERICKITYGNDFTYDKHFLQDYPIVKNYTAKQLINDSYKGGWTQSNRAYTGIPLKFNKKCVSIDINSSYPAVLTNRPLPINKPIQSYNFELNPELKNNFDHHYKEILDYEKNGKLVLLQIAFDGFENKDKNNLLGEIQVGAINKEEFQQHFKNVNSGAEYIHTNIINNNKLIGGNCKHEIYRYVKTYWSFELNDMLKHMNFYYGEQQYCSIRENYFKPKKLNLIPGFKILAATIFDSCIGFFNNGIMDGVRNKQLGKQLGNKILESANKMFINSFTGKLAANPERRERKCVYNEDKKLMEYEATNIYYEDPHKYYKALTSAICAWGRCNLREKIYLLGYENILYMDTDSCYTTLTGDEIKAKIPNDIDPLELGKWDIEKEYTEFKSIGSKKYILYGGKYETTEDHSIICRCAGLPEDVRKKLTFDTFKLNAEIEGKLVKHKVQGGYTLINAKFKICDNLL